MHLVYLTSKNLISNFAAFLHILTYLLNFRKKMSVIGMTKGLQK